MVTFLVTTKVDRLPTDKQVIMLDGTVPKWEVKKDDLHFDHHRAGGSKIQIDEINSMYFEDIKDDAVIVTTQVDADACVAAAYILYGKFTPGYGKDPKALMSHENFRKLRAIAFDCDYLYVPHDLSDLSDFAAQAVAAMKSNSDELINDLNLPKNKNDWNDQERELFYSKSFELGTIQLIEACQGKRKFPGESGEAKSYWDQVESDVEMYINENRIEFYKGCAIAHLEDISRYVDPRAFYKAVNKLVSINEILLPITLVVQPRREKDGIRYTLGSLPNHPGVKKLDYSKAKVWEALTKSELLKNPEFQGWGGRAIVGGSSWNNPSLLSCHEVIDITIFEILKNWFD